MSAEDEAVVRDFIDHTPYRGPTSKAVIAHEALTRLIVRLARLEQGKANVLEALDELEASGSDPAPLEVVRLALAATEEGAE